LRFAPSSNSATIKQCPRAVSASQQ
jgi:hypothetical protein